jgi:MFS family permease
MAASGIALAVGFGLMAAAPAIGVALVGTTLGGAGNGVQSVAARTALQEYTPEKWMALVMSLNESVSQAAPGVGILLGGLLAAWGDPRIALAVAGVGSLAFAVAVWIVLRPSVMPAPPVETDVIRASPRDPGPIVPTATASSETLV